MKKFIWVFILVYCSCLFPQMLSVEQCKADMDTVLSVLSEIHPTFNGSVNKKKIIKLKDQQGDSISVHEFFQIIQPLVALDGHTTLQFTGKIFPDIENPLLPFETVVYKNKLYIKTNLSGNDSVGKGIEILSINAVPVKRILKTMYEYLPGEMKANKIRKLDNAGFANWFRLVYGNFEKFDLVCRNDNGKIETTVSGKHWRDFPAHNNPHLQFTQIDQKTALLRIGKFSHPRQFLPFIDSVFTEIDNREIENLIIDKTHGGGFTMLADSLMSYLIDEPFVQFEKKYIRISRESAGYIAENADDGRYDGDYFVIENEPVRGHKQKRAFHGNLYVLTGPTAYSAATLFVAMAKSYLNAVIVGEQAGQPLISNGDLSRHALPNSGMQLYTSHSTYYLPGYKNTRNSVKPHHRVERSLDDLLNENDPYLEYTLNLIKYEK